MTDYLEIMGKVMSDLERIYGLSGTENGNRISLLNIEDVLEIMKKRAANLDRESRIRLNSKASNATIPLAYVKDRMRWYKRHRLDFSRFVNLDLVIPVLKSFTSQDTITDKSYQELNILVRMLSQIDRNFVGFKEGLAYKFCRMVVVMIIYQNHVDAAILSRFILEQIITKVKGGK